jgi:hypothetical protein
MLREVTIIFYDEGFDKNTMGFKQSRFKYELQLRSFADVQLGSQCIQTAAPNLFNDAVSNSDCRASNDWIIVNNELERM